jgi:electron transport complex protein RnfE
MGVFIPLIVVNCIIMARVDSFSYRNSVREALFDALGMGLGYTWVLCGVGTVRELLGSGSILGHAIIPAEYTIAFFTRAPGGFVVFALFLAVTAVLKRRKGEKVLDGPACCTVPQGGAQ